MKPSALRAWLRQERAREHAEWMDADRYTWDEVPVFGTRLTARIARPGSMREPRADVHIHGRDCDQGWPTCGVEGEYPSQ